MKFILNRPQKINARFLYHEGEHGDRITEVAAVLKDRTEEADLSDEEIHDLAHKFVDLLETNQDFAAAFQEALGDHVDPEEVDTWQAQLEAHLNADLDPATNRAIEDAIETDDEDAEPSGVAIPLSKKEFNEIYENLETPVHIPDSMRAEIESYVIHNLETSRNPDDKDNTERLSQEQQEALASVMIANHAIFLRTLQMANTQMDGSPMPTDPEDDVESITDVIHRIADEFEHVAPSMLQRAVAGNHDGFGLDDNGQPKDYTEEDIHKLAEKLNQTGAEIDEQVRAELAAQGITPDSPQYQQAYDQRFNERMNQVAEKMTLEDVETLGDLIKLFLQYMYPENYEEGGPVDANGRPLATAIPRGNTRAAENAPNHVDDTQLNEAFYGEAMVKEFRELPPKYIEAAQAITADTAWGPGNIADTPGGEPASPAEEISGWKLSVMRNAINSKKQGKEFSASRPFFANDLALRRAIIYIPNRSGGPIKTTCVGGSGGVSNVSESHGSPLGSFSFEAGDVRDRRNSNKPQYVTSASVHGMEPMQSNYRTSHEQATNLDPSLGNTNSAGRAILMHGVRDGQRSTWGCWGVPGPVAAEFGQAIVAHGGASGEAFLSLA